MTAAGQSNPVGYGGGPEFDGIIPPDNETGYLSPEDYDRTPLENWGYLGESEPGYDFEEELPEDISTFIEEESKGTYLLNYNQDPWEEIIIFAKKTAVRTSGGRQYSDCCYLLVGNKNLGQIGVGYGMAASASNAKERARAEALRNLRSAPGGKLVQAKVMVKHRKTIMILTPRRKGVKCSPLFKKLMVDYFKMDSFSLKIHGRKNPLRTIPLFFKLIDNIMTEEQRTLGRGIIPLYAGNKYANYLEKIRRNRGQFGWH